MNKTLKIILWPLVLIRRQYESYLCKKDPERLFCIRYKRQTGTSLNTQHPSTLYDKIAFMAFHTDTSEWSRLADKIAVREYVKECGYGENLPQLYGVWNRAEDVDFTSLPDSFVIKTNNASATNIIVKNKETLDIRATRKKLNNWLKWEYGLETCQPHYSRIKPQILAEEFLIDSKTTRDKSLIDYKFYCLNGIPMYVMVITDRKENTHDVKVSIFDMNWKRYSNFVSTVHEEVDLNLQQPVSFNLMKKMASDLSKKHPFCRVDFYEINERPIFGEMTFTPGFDSFSQSFQEELGKYCKLNVEP